MSNIDKFLSSLRKVKKTGSSEWIACCPAHDDKSPSMAISDRDGTVLIKCFAGCGIDEIASAVGMDLTEFFPEREIDYQRVKPKINFNARDVLECLRSDSYFLGVFVADIAKGKQSTPEQNEAAIRAAGRIIAATRMGGV